MFNCVVLENDKIWDEEIEDDVTSTEKKHEKKLVNMA